MCTTPPVDPFEEAFRQSVNIRKCTYDPSRNFVPVNDEYGERKVLSLAYKLTWFHAYCSQNGIVGRIENHEYFVHTFDSVGTGMVTASAKVFFGNEIIATAVASKSFPLNAPEAFVSVVQAASGNALSKALSNAGFATISAMEASSEDLGNAPNPAGGPALPSANQQNSPPVPQETAPIGYTGDSSPAPTATGAAQTSFFQDTTPPVNDKEREILAAKSLVYTQKREHPNNGKTLGQILATNPSAIEWLASHGKGQYKEAATLLLPEALSRMGKPVPA